MIEIDFCAMIPVFLVKTSKLLHYNIGMSSSQRAFLVLFLYVFLYKS